ncbi:GNAT family N-acetyltransferase [Candidatus Kapabacteria bacterium]|nr:GNAT family N-acetyltransferase [Candidatus Kapabacteria bacterium]
MLNQNLYIETDRLLIRPFTLEDIEPSYEMNLDEEVSKYTGDGGVVSKKEIERRIVENVFGDYKKHGFGRLAVELKEENKFIGFTGLKYLEDLNEVDLGYRFMKEYWGRGIATESSIAVVKMGFNKLELKKLIAMVLPGNIGSIRVLEKLKFKYEKDIIEDKQLARIYSLYK